MLVHQAASRRSVRASMRVTVSFIAIGAMGVIAAGAAEAGSWKGAKLEWQYYAFGDPYNGNGSPGECKVQGSATTCGTFTGYFNIVTDKKSITFDYSPSGAGSTWSKSALSLPPTIHNGVAINLTSSGTITSVKIDPATNMVGFKKNRVSFTANQIQVDWQKLAFDSSTVVKLDVKFENATAGAPAIRPVPTVALADHPTQKAKLTDNPPRRR
jgi:hypothetical protein